MVPTTKVVPVKVLITKCVPVKLRTTKVVPDKVLDKAPTTKVGPDKAPITKVVPVKAPITKLIQVKVKVLTTRLPHHHQEVTKHRLTSSPYKYRVDATPNMTSTANPSCLTAMGVLWIPPANPYSATTLVAP